MNWDQVQGNWKQFKGKAQQVWGDFTDDDLDVIEGKREELVGQLQTKYGYTNEKAEQEADTWVRGL
ncbi:MAG: CsbD family protein [Gammaproteobacteria bacterium]